MATSYNVTGDPFTQPQLSSTSDTPTPLDAENDNDDTDADADLKKKKKKKKKKKLPHVPGDEYCRRRKNRDKIACQPRIPRHASPESPSRTNRFGTPLGYAQFFMPDVNDKKGGEPGCESVVSALLLLVSTSPNGALKLKADPSFYAGPTRQIHWNT